MLRFLVVGAGQCGNRVADAVAREARQGGMSRFLGGRKLPFELRVLAVNSAETDLSELRSIPPRDRVALKGGARGSGANREVGRTMFEESRERVQAAVHAAAPWDLAIVVTSSGGGTGSGSAPGLVDLVRNLVPAPVVVVTVLPFKEESDIFVQNTGFTLKDLRAAKPTSVVLASNDFLKQGGQAGIVEAYERINTTIAKRLVFLLDCLSSEMMMSADLGDVVTVLDAGSGFATMGFAQATPHAPLREVIEASFAKPNLLFEADPLSEASRAMLVMEGGEEHLTMEDITASVTAFSQKVGDVFKAVRVTSGPPRVLSLFSLRTSAELERVLDAAASVIERRRAKRADTESESKLASKFDRVEGYEIEE